MTHRLPWRIRGFPLILASLVVIAVSAADGPTRPGSGPRPRKTAPGVPAPPPPAAGEWTTQTGQGGTKPVAPAPSTEATPTPEEPAGLVDVTPPPPEVDPLFDDRPVASFESVTWAHAPSANVVSNETYTEQACTRLLADDTLPGAARGAVLGGRARARMRMWRLDAARADIEAAVALDPRSAPLHLVHAELLACFNSTDEADSVVQQAFALDPESTLSARALGLIRFQQGSLQSAADALAAHLRHSAATGTATGDSTLPLLHAVAASETTALQGATEPEAPWIAQLAAHLTGRIDRETLLARAHEPRGAAPDEAACTAWFYLGQRSLARAEKERATLDLLACLRTGHTALPEYRIAVAQLIRLGALKPDSLPGRLAQ